MSSSDSEDFIAFDLQEQRINESHSITLEKLLADAELNISSPICRQVIRTPATINMENVAGLIGEAGDNGIDSENQGMIIELEPFNVTTDGSSLRSEKFANGSSLSSVKSTKSQTPHRPSSGCSVSGKSSVDMTNCVYKEPFEYGLKQELFYHTKCQTENSGKRMGDVYYNTTEGKRARKYTEADESLTNRESTTNNFTFSQEPFRVDEPDKEIVCDVNIGKGIDTSKSVIKTLEENLGTPPIKDASPKTIDKAIPSISEKVPFEIKTPSASKAKLLNEEGASQSSSHESDDHEDQDYGIRAFGSLGQQSRKNCLEEGDSPAVEAQIIGINRLMIGEYVYRIKESKAKNMLWYCNKYYNRHGKRCTAKASTSIIPKSGGPILIYRSPNESPHNHPPDPSDIEEARTNLGKSFKNAVLRGTLSIKTGRSLETQTNVFMKNKRRYQTFLSKFAKNPTFDRKSIYQAVSGIRNLQISQTAAINIILNNQAQVMADLEEKKAEEDKLASTQILRSSTISTSNPLCPMVMSTDATEPDEASRVYVTSTEASTSQTFTPSLILENEKKTEAPCHTASSHSVGPSSTKSMVPVVPLEAIPHTDVRTSISLPSTAKLIDVSTEKQEASIQTLENSAISTSTPSHLTMKSLDASEPHFVLQMITPELTSVIEKTVKAIFHAAFSQAVTSPNPEALSPEVAAKTIAMLDTGNDATDKVTNTVNKIIEKLGNETTSGRQIPDSPANSSPSPVPGPANDQNVQSEIGSDLDMSSNDMVTSSTQSPLIANPTQAIDEVSQPKTTPAKQSLDTVASVPCTEAAESGKNTEATRQTSTKNGEGIGNKNMLEILTSTMESVQRLTELVMKEKTKKKKKKKEERKTEKKRKQRDRNSGTLRSVSDDVPQNESQSVFDDTKSTISVKEEIILIDLTEDDDVKMNIVDSQPYPNSETTSLDSSAPPSTSMMNVPVHPVSNNRNPTLHEFNTAEYVPVHQYPISPLAQNVLYLGMMPYVHPLVQTHEHNNLNNAQV